jgi:hypothetical protein
MDGNEIIEKEGRKGKGRGVRMKERAQARDDFSERVSVGIGMSIGRCERVRRHWYWV